MVDAVTPGKRIHMYLGTHRDDQVAISADATKWFQGTIVQLEERGSGPILTVATLLYDAVRGFPSFRQEVLVTRGAAMQTTLTCMLTGRCLPWRFLTDFESSASTTREGRTEAIRDNVEGMGACLETRVAYLETALIAQRYTLSRLHPGVRPESVASLQRPLMYIRVRLNELLQQSLRFNQVKGSNAPNVMTDSLQCNADCSLAEFESKTLHAMSSNIRCMALDPHCTYSDIPRLHEAALRIEVGVLADIFALIGMTSKCIAARSVMKSRKGRRSAVDHAGSAVTAYRIIGQLLCPGQKQPDPMCISIGHIVKDKIYEHLPDEVPVLLREDTTWSDVDSEYEHPLSLQLLPRARCKEMRVFNVGEVQTGSRRKRRRILSPPTIANEDDAFGFTLHWERCNKPPGDIICGTTAAHDIPGRVHLVLPVVIIADTGICAEMRTLCGDGKLQGLLS